MTAHTTNTFDPHATVNLYESTVCISTPEEGLIDAWCVSSLALAQDRSWLRAWCYEFGGEQEYPFDLVAEDPLFQQILDLYPGTISWLSSTARKGYL